MSAYDSERTIKYGKLRLATIDLAEYINLIIETNKGRTETNKSLCVEDGDVQWLRDELNRLYPPEKLVKEADEYYVKATPVIGYGDDWVIRKRTTKRVDERVGSAETEEDAKRIVKALNEAEGL